MFSGCVGTQYLKKDEKLLFKQKIKGNEKVSTDDLEELYIQQANKRIFFMPISPYVAFYQIGEEHYDKEAIIAERDSINNFYDNRIVQERAQGNTKKVKKLEKKKVKKMAKYNKNIEEGNLLMRWGEKLSVYDSINIAETKAQIQSYLESKGYFNAEVSIQEKIKGIENKQVVVTYQIEEQEAHVIDTSYYRTGSDTIIYNLLIEHIDESLIEERDNYDQEVLVKERERIESLLKDNGYYAFSRQFIEFNVLYNPDTTTLTIETIINQPASGGEHKQYELNEVNFTTDVNIQLSVKREKEIFNTVNYFYYKPQFKKKILDQRVFLRPGELYSQTNTFNTQRQLANLDMFKFINIKYDTAGGEFIANIFTSPLKKYQISNELGVNVTQGYPGPYYNVSLKNRNPFGGLEILELSGRVGIEGVAPLTDQTEIYGATEYGGNLSLTFPHFLLPLGTAVKSKFGVLNPKTKIAVGYNFTRRQEYVRSNLNSSFGYSWFNKRNWQYNYTVADVSVINSNINLDGFREFLEQLGQNGSQLQRSFEPSFVTSSYLSISKNFNNYGNTKERASYLAFFLETGGNLLHFDGIAEQLDTTRYNYFQFVKASADFRHYLPSGKNSTLAFRLNIGVANPYGEFSQSALPYEKYFFAGGSNSIRAWTPRRLGPGGFNHLDSTGNFNYDYEEPGELILEASIESRRKLFQYVDGAVFLDAGNVWLMEESDAKPNGHFEFDRFYKEIALGAGIGLRIDFSFLILRFDAGFKLYDPAQPEGNRWVIDKINLRPRDVYGPTLNIGIGYPF